MHYKQVILIRDDLKLTKGKMAAQACHASVEAVLKSNKETVAKWKTEGMGKIILKVKDQKELLAYQQKAKDAGLVIALITDAGHTHLEPGTMTCLGIGPDQSDKIDAITSELKLIS